jgi:hypothetical protein
MSLLSILTPVNLFEEKKKFFADPEYNPQFIYEEHIAEDKLLQYGLPQKKYAALAKEILDRAYHNRNTKDLLKMEGEIISQDEVKKKVDIFLKMHDLQKKIKPIWSQSFISRVSINASTIKFKLPSTFRKEDVLGMLYHEIGTHAIRRVNYEQQPWFRKKKKYGFESYLRTEEGLAISHSLIPYSFKSAYKSALRYLAVDYAQSHSFSQLYSFLGKYIDNPETRWEVAVKQKRGLEDTSLGGGFSRSLVYFEGFVDTWQYLKKHNFDITNLYFGKMSYKDTDKALEMNPDFQPLLPSFFVLNKDKYASDLEKIGLENRLGEF